MSDEQMPNEGINFSALLSVHIRVLKDGHVSACANLLGFQKR
jgi:hypothetical protein